MINRSIEALAKDQGDFPPRLEMGENGVVIQERKHRSSRIWFKMGLLPERVGGFAGCCSGGGNHEASSFLFACLGAPDFVPGVGGNVPGLQRRGYGSWA